MKGSICCVLLLSLFVVVGCVSDDVSDSKKITIQKRPANELPMYGGEYEPTYIRIPEASEKALKLGWKYYYAKDYDTAIKRFNQAWMYNRESAGAFWGFGLITAQRAEKLDGKEFSDYQQKAINYLKKALTLDENSYRIMTDLGIAYMGLGAFQKEKGDPASKTAFLKAEHLFVRAKQFDEKYPVLWMNWAYLKFYQGDFDQSKQYLKRAKELGFPLNAAFEKDLMNASTKR